MNLLNCETMKCLIHNGIVECDISNSFKIIKRHDPYPGYEYNYLYANPLYPDRKFKLFCKHVNTMRFEVIESNSALLNKSYIHVVCMDCGKILSVEESGHKRLYEDE